MLHIYARSFVFILLCDLSRHGGVLKFKRDGKFYVVFDVSVLPQGGFSWHFKALIIINFACIVNFISLSMYLIIFMSMILASKKECFSSLKIVLF